MEPGRSAVIDDAVRDAIAISNLRGVPGDTLDRLFERARRLRYTAGSTIRGAGASGPHLELVVRGFVRIFVMAPDGRSLTVRYLRRGALAGVVSLFTPRFSMPASIQALLDTDLLVIDPVVVRDLAERDLSIAQGLLAELSERVVSFVAEIPGSAFTTVRERVARHLLDLASQEQHGHDLVAHISQQTLADAVGSVREVVVRVLRELREEGVILTGRAGITILDPDRLAGAHPAVAPAAAEAGWNTGS